MRSEHLDYFKDLLEGRATMSWNAWFARHEAQLAAELPRAVFLRLKFHKLDEAEKLLRAENVAYTPDPAAARRERYYASLHPDVLDSLGRPREEVRARAYDGALGQLMRGEWKQGQATLAAYVRRIRRFRPMRRAEELEDLCFDGEMEWTLGDPRIGRALLEAVASVPRGNDLVDPAIERALQLLGHMPGET